ncbi:hypothetical protein IKA15_00440 [bacterium]|nr:hypothetical protein [bacterium]
MTEFISNYQTQSANRDPLNNIRGTNIKGKAQLKKVCEEFEGIFVAKMMSTLDKTVDRENSLFQESKYLTNLKSVMYADLGRQVATSPTSNIGLAAQMYKQLERTVID